MSIKKCLLLSVCILIGTMSYWGNLHAQQSYRSSSGNASKKPTSSQQKKGFDIDRLIYGGGMFGGGGNNSIAIGLSPMVGYRITDFWSAGISLGYRYFYTKDYFRLYNNTWQRHDYYNLNQHIFTPGVWTRLRVFKNIFTHFEFENVVTSFKYYEAVPQNNFEHIGYRITDNVPCLLVGGGLRQPLGDNSSFVFYGLYDVLQNVNMRQDPNNPNRNISRSPYARTLDIRVGVNFGF
jgi:hypothetical protein